MKGRLAGSFAAATFLLGTGFTATNTATTRAVVSPVRATEPPSVMSLTTSVKVVNRRSNKCLQADNGRLTPGTWVVQQNCRTPGIAKWFINSVAVGENGVVYSRLRVAGTAPGAGQCLEVNQAGGSGGLGRNAKVLLWNCHGGRQQQWEKITLGTNVFQFKNRRSGLCLEVDQRIGGGLADGGGVLQWTCHGGAQQRWILSNRL